MNTEWKELSTLQQVAEAQANNWEIEVYDEFDDEWVNWIGINWIDRNKYRGRPAQPKMKTVKLEAWLMPNGELVWFDMSKVQTWSNDAIRVPEEDKEITLP